METWEWNGRRIQLQRPQSGEFDASPSHTEERRDFGHVSEMDANDGEVERRQMFRADWKIQSNNKFNK